MHGVKRRSILPMVVAPLAAKPDVGYCADWGAFLPWYQLEAPRIYYRAGLRVAYLANRGLCSDCLHGARKP
jgi:hypothetical protein